jgi:thiosulfate/3-mercaptopyruvate sulfurtransferase
MLRRRVALLALLLAGGFAQAPAAGRDTASTARPSPAAKDTARVDGDTLTAAHLIQPQELALALNYPVPRRPVVLQVGFKVLFRTGHIAGSRFVGPGSKPEGLAALDSVLKAVTKQQRIVLYCGCCPWQDCPNVHPAFHRARELGYRNVQVLFIRKNLQEDWIAKGLPMREGDP